MRLRLPGWLTAGRAELAPMALVLLTAGGLLVSLYLAGNLGGGGIDAIDRALLLAMRNPADPADPLGPVWLEQAVRDLTSLGSTTVLTLVCLSVAGFLIKVRRAGAAWLVLGSVGGGALLSTALKEILARSRPDVVAQAAPVFTASLPSGHAMLSAVAYLTLGALLAETRPEPRVKTYVLAVAIGLTLAVGVSRIYLGVHWPTDVLAGWCLGAVWAMLCWTIARRRSGRKQA